MGYDKKANKWSLDGDYLGDKGRVRQGRIQDVI